jgi:hypothetical protein
VPRQVLAEATLVSLGNGFVLSCVALLPTVNVGWVALGLGLWGVIWAGRIAQLLARAHPHGGWSHELRVTSLSLLLIALYATEFGFGLALVRRPASAAVWSGLGLIILGAYALGLARLDPAGRSPVRLERLAESVGGPRCGSAG